MDCSSIVIQGWDLMRHREIKLGGEICLVAVFRRVFLHERMDVFFGDLGLMIITFSKNGLVRRNIL